MIRLAVLDMAGTTVDEGGAVYRALDAAVAATTGRPVPEAALARWMGADKREAVAGLLAALGAPHGAADVEATFAEFSARLDEAYLAVPPSPIAGIEDAFAGLRARDVRIVLTTGFSTRVATVLVLGLGWRVGATIDGVVTAEQVGAGRPSPKMIERAMALTDVADPRQVLAAGDTLLDLQAGANAGAGAVVGVLTGAQDRATLEAGPATHVIASAALLPELIDTLGVPRDDG
jgi:phosphonatase-like hydrolase